MVKKDGRSNFVPILVMVVIIFSSLFLLKQGLTGAVVLSDSEDCGTTITDDSTLSGDLDSCSDDGIIIGADDITLDCQGHSITGDGNTGIIIDSHTGITIKNCTIEYFDYGIYMEDSDGNFLEDNNINNNYYEAVYLDNSDNNTISRGEMGHNNDDYDYAGIYLYESTGNTIQDIYMHDNSGGAIYLEYSPDNTIDNNNINNNCGDERQIFIEESDDVVIKNNDITEGTGYGIEMWYSSGSQIMDNNISGNALSGIFISGGSDFSDHTITGNTVIGNSIDICDDNCDGNCCGAGIRIDYENNVLIQGNTVSDNRYNGISLYYSSNSQILDNTVEENNHFGIRLRGDFYPSCEDCSSCEPECLWYALDEECEGDFDCAEQYCMLDGRCNCDPECIEFALEECSGDFDCAEAFCQVDGSCNCHPEYMWFALDEICECNFDCLDFALEEECDGDFDCAREYCGCPDDYLDCAKSFCLEERACDTICDTECIDDALEEECNGDEQCALEYCAEEGAANLCRDGGYCCDDDLNNYACSEQTNNIVSGNTIINNSDVGIRVGQPQNLITENTIIGDGSFYGDYWDENYGIYVYSDDDDPNNNCFEDNEISGYYYGMYAEYVDDLTINEDIHDNYYGIYLDDIGDEQDSSLIQNSKTHDNCYGVYVYDSYLTITDTNFEDNNLCNPDDLDFELDSIFEEDFSTSADGFVSRKGDWYVGEGQYYGDKEDFVYGLTVKEDLEIADFVLESEVKWRTGAAGANKQVGIAFRIQDQSTIDCGEGNYKSARYILVMDVSTDTIRIEDHSGICEEDPNYYDAIILGQADYDVNVGSSYDFLLIARDNRFIVYVDGDYLFSVVDTNNRYPTGKIGYMFRNANSVFDNLYLYEPTGYGLYVDYSHVNLENGNFIDNNVYGLYDQEGDSVYWTITDDIICQNNDIEINEGWIVPMGGSITAEDCTIIVEGEELDLEGGQQGSIEFELDTSGDNQDIIGSSTEGFEAEIHTNSSFSGTIDIDIYDENPGDSGFALTGLGKWIDVSVSGPINLTWWILKIYYTDEEVAGFDESTLRIEYYNETSGTWETYNPPDGGVNESENYVWAKITHFSIFGVFGSLTPAPPSTSGGGARRRAPRVCDSYWLCGEWGKCINNSQNRTCQDVNECFPDRTETEYCIMPEPVVEAEPIVELEELPAIIEEAKKGISGTVIALVALVIIAAGLIGGNVYHKKQLLKPHLTQLDNAINKSLREGHSQEKIKQAIIEKGWPEKIANREIEKVLESQKESAQVVY